MTWPPQPRARARAAALGLGALGVLLVGCPSAVVHKPPAQPVAAQPRAKPAPKTHAEPELDGREHTVQPGETLWRISRAYGVSVEELVWANDLDDASRLESGQKLFVPGAGKTARPAAGGPEPEQDPEPRRPDSRVEGRKARLSWPLQGVLYAKFGKRGESIHEGIDLCAPEGTVIGAAGEGLVLFSGFQRGYGHIVIVDHGEGLLTLYAHNLENLVKDGTRVRAGDPLARIGSGTRTSGPHVHFEVREGRAPRNPLDYLPDPR